MLLLEICQRSNEPGRDRRRGLRVTVLVCVYVYIEPDVEEPSDVLDVMPSRAVLDRRNLPLVAGFRWDWAEVAVGCQ